MDTKSAFWWHHEEERKIVPAIILLRLLFPNLVHKEQDRLSDIQADVLLKRLPSAREAAFLADSAEAHDKAP